MPLWRSLDRGGTIDRPMSQLSRGGRAKQRHKLFHTGNGVAPCPMRGDVMRRFWLMLLIVIVIVVLFFGFVLSDSLPKLLVRNFAG
jgi:hypothetical protein